MSTLALIWILVSTFPEHDQGVWTPYPSGYDYPKEETCMSIASLYNKRSELGKHGAVYDCVPIETKDKNKAEL